MTTKEDPATFEPGEPEPPYVDNSPPAAPEELDDRDEPEFQPRNDVVDEVDPQAETQGGMEPE